MSASARIRPTRDSAGLITAIGSAWQAALGNPPLLCSSWPLIHCPRSESRNLTRLATSCGVPNRPVGCGGQNRGSSFVVHPAGVDRTGIDDVGSEPSVTEFVGGGEHHPVQRRLGRPVGQIADGVITGQRDHSTAVGRNWRANAASIRNEAPDVDRVMPVQTLREVSSSPRSTLSQCDMTNGAAGRPAPGSRRRGRSPTPGPPDPSAATRRLRRGSAVARPARADRHPAPPGRSAGRRASSTTGPGSTRRPPNPRQWRRRSRAADPPR